MSPHSAIPLRGRVVRPVPEVSRRRLLLALLLLATGCASQQPQRPGKGTPATQRPYTVFGRTYHPLPSAEGFEEEGVASWYGPDFHGKRTSCGEVYDMNGMTAAHKLLPMNTMLRVTNLNNGRELTVRVNDRGPFVGDRIIDLSYGAACQLDMVGHGTARVRIESLGPVSGATGNDLRGVFYVQVGAFGVRDNAVRLAGTLRQSGYPGTRVQEAVVDGSLFFRVQAGEFSSLSEAYRQQDTLSRQYPSAFVVAR